MKHRDAVSGARSMLQRELAHLALPVPSSALSLLSRHCHDIARWSAATDVSGLTDELEVASLLVVPTLRLAPVVVQLGAVRLIDIGAGSGAGSLPLAALLPQVRVTCVESRRKAVVFLEHSARRMGVKVAVAHGRAETLAHDPAMRGRFDLALCRAVGPLAETIELALPFVRSNGAGVFWRPSGQPLSSNGVADVFGGRSLSQPLRLDLGQGMPVDAWLVSRLD